MYALLTVTTGLDDLPVRLFDSEVEARLWAEEHPLGRTLADIPPEHPANLAADGFSSTVETHADTYGYRLTVFAAGVPVKSEHLSFVD